MAPPDPSLPDSFPAPARPLSLHFEGFAEEAFAALERLREEPHVGRYREEKAALRRWVQEPFGRYRDDLAANWVLPNLLPLETERGVFSRLLKNDFGAGGAHHHLWMSFYRLGRKRLADVQLSHAIWPDRFAWTLYAGDYAGPLFRALRARMADEPARTAGLFNDLLRRGYRLSFADRVTKPEGHAEVAEPLAALPQGLLRAKGLWVTRAIPRSDALALGPDLVPAALDAMAELWPLYRFWLGAEGGEK